MKKKNLSIEEIVKLKQKEKYSFKNYKPNKNCVSVIYKGKKYKSKTQCIVLEDITRKELDVYLEDSAQQEVKDILIDEVQEFPEWISYEN